MNKKKILKANKGCSIHGEDGNADCNECWGRLGDLIEELDEKVGGIHVVGDSKTKRRLQT